MRASTSWATRRSRRCRPTCRAPTARSTRSSRRSASPGPGRGLTVSAAVAVAEDLAAAAPVARARALLELRGAALATDLLDLLDDRLGGLARAGGRPAAVRVAAAVAVVVGHVAEVGRCGRGEAADGQEGADT